VNSVDRLSIKISGTFVRFKIHSNTKLYRKGADVGVSNEFVVTYFEMLFSRLVQELPSGFADSYVQIRNIFMGKTSC